MPRGERLRALAQVPGVYIPSLYQPRYGGGDLTAIGPVGAGLPAIIKKRTWSGTTPSVIPR